MGPDGEPLLNLRHLQCFVAAVDAGTLTAGAERLQLSQPAMSLAVASLERALGAQVLLRRRSQPLVLTDAGRRLLPEARELLSRAEELRAEINEAGVSLAGRLTVGCYRTAAPYVLPALLETFAGVCPDVDVAFVEATLPELRTNLLDGSCEIALIYDLDVGPGLTTEALYRTAPYALLAPQHPLASCDPVELTDLAPHPMIMLDVPPSRHYFEDVFAAVGVQPAVRYVTSGYELLRSMVGRNLGYGLLISRPHGDVTYEGLPVLARPLGGAPLGIDVSLAWAAGARPTRRARAFAEHCRRSIPGQMGYGVGRVTDPGR